MSKKKGTQPLESGLSKDDVKEGLLSLSIKEQVLVTKIIRRAIKRDKSN